MATKVGEFFIDLAVDAASGNLSVNQLVASLGELSVAGAAGMAGVGKITQALLAMANAASNTAVEMSILKDTTGADPKMVQQWEKAAQRINVQSGSITRSITAVHNMMGQVQAGKGGLTGELVTMLGVSPYTGQYKNGRPVFKEYTDIMAELANPKSKYWTYTDAVKQNLLGAALPGSNAQDNFRILNEMRAGKFRPENISVLEDKQVGELTAVKRKEIEIGQQITGIFDKLLLGGGALATVLESVTQKLSALDKWLGSKWGNESLGIVGKEISSIVRNLGNPYTIGKDAGSFLAEEFGLKPSSTPRLQPAIQMGDLSGKLDVRFLGPTGSQVGRQEVFLGRKVSNSDVQNVTVNAGNGGPGQ